MFVRYFLIADAHETFIELCMSLMNLKLSQMRKFFTCQQISPPPLSPPTTPPSRRNLHLTFRWHWATCVTCDLYATSRIFQLAAWPSLVAIHSFHSLSYSQFPRDLHRDNPRTLAPYPLPHPHHLPAVTEHSITFEVGVWAWAVERALQMKTKVRASSFSLVREKLASQPASQPEQRSEGSSVNYRTV